MSSSSARPPKRVRASRLKYHGKPVLCGIELKLSLGHSLLHRNYLGSLNPNPSIQAELLSWREPRGPELRVGKQKEVNFI